MVVPLYPPPPGKTHESMVLGNHFRKKFYQNIMVKPIHFRQSIVFFGFLHQITTDAPGSCASDSGCDCIQIPGKSFVVPVLLRDVGSWDMIKPIQYEEVLL